MNIKLSLLLLLLIYKLNYKIFRFFVYLFEQNVVKIEILTKKKNILRIFS